MPALGATLSCRHPKARRPEAPHELARVDEHRSECHEFVVAFGWHVVVVAIEPALRDPSRASERVQLLERGLRDQVPPDAAMIGPQRGIKEDRHVASLCRHVTSCRRYRENIRAAVDSASA